MKLNKKKRCIAKIMLCIFVVALLSATAFAVNDGDVFSFSLPSGGTQTYNMKSRDQFWYPLSGSATWDVAVHSTSSADIGAALYYIKAFASDKYVYTLSVDAGQSDSHLFTATGNNAYYAILNASDNGGTTGNTGMEWVVD